jgi:hypothetical protein
MARSFAAPTRLLRSSPTYGLMIQWLTLVPQGPTNAGCPWWVLATSCNAWG